MCDPNTWRSSPSIKVMTPFEEELASDVLEIVTACDAQADSRDRRRVIDNFVQIGFSSVPPIWNRRRSDGLVAVQM